MAALQLQTVFDSYNRFKKDISDVDSTLFLDWCNYMMEIIWHELVNSNPDSLFETTTISVTSGTAEYDLPADFDGLKGYGNGFYPQDSSGKINEGTQIPLTNIGSQQLGYYLDMTQRKVVFTPNPTKDQVYTLRYTPAMPEFTALTDYLTVDASLTGTIIIDSKFRLYTVRAIDTFYTQWDEEPGAESIADFRYIRELASILGEVRTTPGVYTLDGLTNDF